ncbi:glycosyltransferase [Capilliphycus salinus ALCB114379]|uniref:glycosyltransferase n=1 Tax=Capilliphycus salinus TaxID=2768948 RepID=UPI0039A63887
MSENYQPLVSVIVPVYNNSELLRKCLTALENQTYPQERYEVIVVDNASQEDIKSVVSDFKQAKLTFESKPGSYVARNQGISIAKGEVIAFTDSDCIPAKDWIESGVKNLVKLENCGFISGRVEFIFQNPDSPTAIEFYDSFFLNQKKYIREQFGATANIFTYASVFEKVGLFNPNLKSNGDRDWGNRVFAAGYNPSYCSEVCVQHPARNSWHQMYTKASRVMGGKFDRIKQEATFLTYTREIATLIKPPVKFWIANIGNKKLKGKQKFMLIIVTMFVHYSKALEVLRLQFGGTSKRN